MRVIHSKLSNVLTLSSHFHQRRGDNCFFWEASASVKTFSSTEIKLHSQCSTSLFFCRQDFSKRILVATNLFGRGMDIERVNIVFNYDMPEDSDTYLHRVARAGRFGTKGKLGLLFS